MIKTGILDRGHGDIVGKRGMTTHSITLAWRIPWIKEPSRLQSMGSQRVVHNSATENRAEVAVITTKAKTKRS